MQFTPSNVLKPYIKGYLVFSTDKHLSGEVFYPSGFVDIAVNISNGAVTTIINGRSIDMPKVEILGQLTLPTKLIVESGTLILIARIYPYAIPLFFPNPASDFTNDSIDLQAIFSNEADKLYEHLLNTESIAQKVQVLELFFIQQMKKNENKFQLTQFIGQLCNCISSQGESFNSKRLAESYGFSERYIQKLFLTNVGITPRSYFNIRRFNKSLELVRTDGLSLTSIAYDCGYFDQAHFIKEFRKFTGLTPSEVRSLHAANLV